MPPTDHHASSAPGEPPARAGIPNAVLGGIGALSYALAIVAAQPYQWNVVRYAAQRVDAPRYYPSLVFVVLLALAPIAVALWASAEREGRVRIRSALSFLSPLLLSLPFAASALRETGPYYLCALLLILGAGWSAYLSARGTSHRVVERSGAAPGRSSLWAPASILIIIALLTVIHTFTQINFHEHFMLGHADMGHFTEELKNILAGRGMRSDSFPNTRLGWHFTPLLYVMVPGYWLWPSPVYLMVCSALFVHITAIPIYHLTRRLSGSTMVASLFAFAWLMHPSTSRLPYSGTYGFQWLYITLPLTVWLISAGLCNRWRLFFVLFVVVLLCRETSAATTLGLGLYWALFTKHRAKGVAITLVSVVYGIACVTWLIPHFAVSGEYERMEMFGSLGGSFTEVLGAAFSQPGVFWARLIRPVGGLLILTVLTSTALIPLRHWRFCLAAVPALVLILLLENPDWLSIKFWYQVSILPVWFVAAILCVRRREGNTTALPDGNSCGIGMVKCSASPPAANRRSFGVALAVCLCAAWGHYLFGFSPLSKSYELYVSDRRLQTPDPRLDTVRQLRKDLPRSLTILATERMAAHFTDYRRIYTGKREKPADYVIIDRSDAWDATGLAQRVDGFAVDPDYRHYGAYGSVVVFERRPDARVEPED